jgi:hypothetical protein
MKPGGNTFTMLTRKSLAPAKARPIMKARHFEHDFCFKLLRRREYCAAKYQNLAASNRNYRIRQRCKIHAGIYRIATCFIVFCDMTVNKTQGIDCNYRQL